MRILNLYAGIGGNRKLWGDVHKITAVEIDPKIAEIYKDLYPNDTIIIGDAHEYLRQHFREFDFIWASPPCPTHSVLQMTRYYDEKLKYPDMTLYQEIIWLKTFFKGKWVIENVKPYYKPLIPPDFVIGRHFYWGSHKIEPKNVDDKSYSVIRESVQKMAIAYGFDLSKYNISSKLKRQILRNCVNPNAGLYIYQEICKCH